MLDKVKEFYWSLKEDTPVLRCVFGVTLALVFSTTLGYLVPHITAIFTLMFLEPNKRPLGLKKEIGIVLGLSLLGYFGVIVGQYLIDYPLVILPLLGLVIYWSFRFIKIPEPIRLLFLILAVLIPFISLKANLLGSVVLSALLLNLIIALAVIRISFFIFPITSEEDQSIEKKKPQAYKNINLDKLAFNGLVVVFPIVFMFFLFNATVAILTLVFVLLLSFDPFIYQSKKGTALIFANVFGGFAGVLAYNILVIAPSYVLYIFLIISVSFYFVINLYSGKKIAPIFKISFNTFFVVMGVIATSTNEAGNTIWERLIQIGLAILYVIIAFKIVNTLNNPKILNE
jgi:MFS family permease